MGDMAGMDSIAHEITESCAQMHQSSIQFETLHPAPFKTQLIKWIGNKQRVGHEIAAHFPSRYRTYFEPFLGSGAVLGTIRPHDAVGSDSLKPLIEIWATLCSSPATLVEWYRDRYDLLQNAVDRTEAYMGIRDSYNADPNPADLLFLSRSCYGGLMRFRLDGHMTAAAGAHEPISPRSFEQRVRAWVERTRGTLFAHLDFREAMSKAGDGDVVYCDPPYVDTQSILYGAQRFSLDELFFAIDAARARGAKVALSLDGTKRSGDKQVPVQLPSGLFEREATINCGYSHMRRYQMAGKTMEGEVVTDRLLLTW